MFLSSQYSAQINVMDGSRRGLQHFWAVVKCRKLWNPFALHIELVGKDLVASGKKLQFRRLNRKGQKHGMMWVFFNTEKLCKLVVIFVLDENIKLRIYLTINSGYHATEKLSWISKNHNSSGFTFCLGFSWQLKLYY